MDILKLTNSETRKALLELYFAFPEKKYYLRELERLLDLPVQNIRRDLVQLEKDGIFKREKIGNQVFYYLNNESPIFEELKKIVSKTIGMEARLKELFSEMSNLKTVFIFGSFANETADNVSDVDLMIVGEIEEDLLIKKISKIEDQIGREINYHIFSEKEFKKRIKEKDFFITGILSKPIIFLMGNNENIPRIS